jgi:ligand-binding sensor domain-containing protein
MIARWIACLGLVMGLSVSRPAEADAIAGEFVRTLTVYQGRVWVGTFNDGLFVLDGSPQEGLENAHRVSTPFRMVNDALELNGALYVAANEGLFFTGDAVTFERVRQVGARGVTAIAFDGRSLFATTTSALWRVRLGSKGPPDAVWWKPAGSRSLQGVVAERGHVWLASEDRGAILFDGRVFTAYDALAGLPTSWVVAITGDGEGGVFEATLRDGAIHVDAAGAWQPMEGLPSPWTLSVVSSDREVCVGTQDGAACYERRSDAALSRWSAPSSRVDGLPDRRVHAFLATPCGLLVGTEAGMVATLAP